MFFMTGRGVGQLVVPPYGQPLSGQMLYAQTA